MCMCVCVCVCACMCVCMHISVCVCACMCVRTLLSSIFGFCIWAVFVFLNVLLNCWNFIVKYIECYVKDEPEGKFLYTDNEVVLYIVLYYLTHQGELCLNLTDIYNLHRKLTKFAPITYPIYFFYIYIFFFFWGGGLIVTVHTVVVLGPYCHCAQLVFWPYCYCPYSYFCQLPQLQGVTPLRPNT